MARSRAGVRAVGAALIVLAAATAAQAVVFALSGSVALLGDLIHNGGDALTALPLGAAFLMRDERAERGAGIAVVFAIFISACVAAVAAIERFISPRAPSHLGALAVAGAVGFAGNALAARIRVRAGRRLDSAALVADGEHARADAYVSLAVVASALLVALGATVADPVLGLALAGFILRITWQSWRTIASGESHRHDH